MAVKVFIVEDEPMIIEVLKAYLEKSNYIVEYSENGAEGLQRIKESQPDFIILDLMLPDMPGEDICKQIRETSDIPIMMLTAKTAEEDRIEGIVIGADDYITKPFSPREVIVRMEAILRRTQTLNKLDVYSFNQGELAIDFAKREVRSRGNILSMTPIEFNILKAIAKHPGRVFSRADLLQKVQEDHFYEGYERNIDVHIKNLRKKIEKDTKQPQFVLTVFGMGYKFGGTRDVSYTSQ
ncbi:response regulator transcription factor [Texcoconibacillus texcoconensis]|uniref:DNA-binding response OmpR family regulator n=1 Tax=Texcoconibacillus texcoconensis TaxID=1095777 RepID=A0A840QTY7_9BACI|nr:response regulator transcription factor [Texcoconibacillus texcoconensis]MBB5174727.1 DNA-binding response OmpR family regulator [Texcoconibacillus texcoconensis]